MTGRGLLLLGVAVLAGCARAPAPPPQQREARPTIVSLNPCSDAILAEVAAPGQLLAISHYSHDPASTSMPLNVAAQFTATGGTAEEVLALAPDMVVASAFIAPDTRAALEAGGVRVETFGITSSVADSVAQVREMGRLTGEPERAEALALRIDAAWAAAAENAGPPITALLWQEDGIVPGEGTLVAAMLEQSGFVLQSAANGMGQGAYLPLEQVLADPPALLLRAGADPMLRHPVLRELAGTQTREFDSALLFCGGPTIIRALDRLRAVREGLS